MYQHNRGAVAASAYVDSKWFVRGLPWSTYLIVRSVKASRMAVVLVAAVDGLSPFLAAFLVITPFFFASLLPSVAYAYYAAIGMALLALFALGIYLGNLSKENLIVAGIRTCIAGVVCIALTYVLEQLAR